MSSTSWLFASDLNGRTTPSQFLLDHHARLAAEAEERAQQRRVQLTEQRSSQNSPEVRIRIWEKVHQLRLPLDPLHAIVNVVALSTGLTLAEVHEEQRARAQSAKAKESAGSRASAGK